MAAYTIEDIELIRRKSGISYQEAVALLDYHNGNVARALVDLERNGRIKPEGSANANPFARQKASTAGNPGTTGKSGGAAAVDLLTKAYRARVKIRKDDIPILNVSALFAALSVLISPHLVIIGAIVCLVLGYKFDFVKSDAAFAGTNMEKMVRSAAENVKASVNDFAKGFQSAAAGDKQPEAPSQEPAADETAQRSYYQARPTATYRPSYPTMNVPVQVESQDGSVTIESEGDGYSSATVE